MLSVGVPSTGEKYPLFVLPSSRIQQVISEIKEISSQDISNGGLYLSRLGAWLDEERQLFQYTIGDDDILEFRTKANQAVLRILIFDFQVTIAIKVLPDMTASSKIFLSSNSHND